MGKSLILSVPQFLMEENRVITGFSFMGIIGFLSYSAVVKTNTLKDMRHSYKLR